jgi:hypothetical protein
MDIKLSKEEKINIVKTRINLLNIHVPVLEKDILENPNSDVEGKKTRSEVLNDIKNTILAFQQEIDKLNQ